MINGEGVGNVFGNCPGLEECPLSREMGVLRIFGGKCLCTVPEWHKRNLVTLDSSLACA